MLGSIKSSASWHLPPQPGQILLLRCGWRKMASMLPILRKIFSFLAALAQYKFQYLLGFWTLLLEIQFKFIGTLATSIQAFPIKAH
jgi:hypothetical protein